MLAYVGLFAFGFGMSRIAIELPSVHYPFEKLAALYLGPICVSLAISRPTGFLIAGRNGESIATIYGLILGILGTSVIASLIVP